MISKDFQVLNTALIKIIDNDMQLQGEDILNNIKKSSEVKSLILAINNLAKEEEITRDDAAQRILNCVINLSKLWKNHLMLEGISGFKQKLSEEVTSN